MFMELIWNGDQEQVWAKDWEISRFIRRFPNVEQVVLGMRGILPDGRKNYLVDMICRDHLPGDRTCKDVRWHFDGDYRGNNVYALWARGPNRTEFPLTVPELDPPIDRESQNRYLESLGLVGVEVPDMTVAAYDSRTPHRGVVCRVPGNRLFIRVMGTDTIEPRNHLRRDA